jgi:hypothetical protein
MDAVEGFFVCDVIHLGQKVIKLFFSSSLVNRLNKLERMGLANFSCLA